MKLRRVLRRNRGAEPPFRTGADDRRSPWPAIGALAGVVIAITSVIALKQGDADDRGADGRLKIESAEPRNVVARFRGHGNAMTQVQGTMPTLDVLLSNYDEKQALVTEGQIGIEANADLSPCYAQGGGNARIDTKYGFTLPYKPRPRERTVVRAMRRHIPPNESDRFIVRFTTPPWSNDDKHLYRIRVRLRTGDPDRPLDVGRFVFALPDPPIRNGTFFPEEEEILNQLRGLGGPRRAQSIPLASTWCYRKNLAEAARVLAGDARMAPEVKSLGDPPLSPLWEKVQNRTPARRAALRLVDGEQLEPVYAVFAAEATGDTAFVRKVRSRAADVLLRRARRLVEQDETKLFALDLARTSLDLMETREAAKFVHDVERRLRAG